MPANPRLAAGLLASVALHAALLLAPSAPRTPAATPNTAAPLTLRLQLRLQNRRAPLPAAAAPVPSVAPQPSPKPPRSAPPSSAPRAAAAPAPDARTTDDAPEATLATPPATLAAADLMDAARHDAAQFARELGAAENKPANKRASAQALGNTRQARLDRQFDAAFTAAHRWAGALPMREVTRASDGNMRVYVFETPFGKTCMFTRADPNPAPHASAAEQTYYGLCNR